VSLVENLESFWQLTPKIPQKLYLLELLELYQVVIATNSVAMESKRIPKTFDWNG